MAIFTRSITNLSATQSLDLFIPGYDSDFKVTIAPSATLDLLTVVFADQLHCMQDMLDAMVEAGAIEIAGTIFDEALFAVALYGPISAPDTQVVFNPTAGTAAFAVGVASDLEIQSALNVVDANDDETMITVAASGGTTPLINGMASPVTLTVTDGIASILVTDSAAGVVTVSITSVSRPLTHTSTLVATLS